MKKKTINLAIIMMIIFAHPTFSLSTETSLTETTAPESARANVLNERLVEINDMDKLSISRAEKRTLRKEVKDIEKELKGLNDGVYLSVGGLIIIILLVILLL